MCVLMCLLNLCSRTTTTPVWPAVFKQPHQFDQLCLYIFEHNYNTGQCKPELYEFKINASSFFFFSNNVRSTVASGSTHGGAGNGTLWLMSNWSSLNSVARRPTIHPKLFVSRLSFSQQGLITLPTFRLLQNKSTSWQERVSCFWLYCCQLVQVWLK